MRKIFLIIMLIFSILCLSSCGVSAKELKVGGTKAKTKDLTTFEKEYNEYRETNEVKDKWYSIKYSFTTETKKKNQSIVVTGVFFNSRYEFERKIKLNITIKSEETKNDETNTVKTTAKYIYKDGRGYYKSDSKIVEENHKKQETFYGSEAPVEIQSVLYHIELINDYSQIIEVLENYETLYKKSNSFSGKTNKKQHVSQMLFEYKKTYELKSLDLYSKVSTSSVTSVEYLSISSTLIGMVHEPLNPGKYPDGRVGAIVPMPKPRTEE